MGLFNHHDEKYAGLSEEDRKTLEHAHGNLNDQDKQIVKESYTQKDNPDHPANPNHKDHSKFKSAMGSVSNKMGNAAIFGFGASAGSALFNNIF
ncbi:hypothetical protein LTR56_003527 [Elasticomyces elasticus]|uniref:Uncharacterized protein n=1 Tax=Elasticomyces elasticus TaxID=574655 RepID=A0AAN8A225_9PEZI|nr:hypothetical protein LTR22_017855 [Elasticomyces elasticus]KAK3648932.1 hypothetical protein LTR22_013157 [Elasticomyces elasticus]KAK3654926.1 hypothetical protein LTR56_003784 [Elasticomyces elasticus]KAK3655520.1 hypothetical protein LTR56_003527 [Elasticomyces elasticus]KAK4917458.1 hypothetical protein LTR49_014678 [Elasticomyces elasticus]